MRALKTITQVFDRCAAARVMASLVLCLAALIFSPLSAHAETATLQYDNNGNITQRTTPLGTTTYTYDPLNRLKSEAGPAKTQNFTYDENGNRLSDGAGSYTYETGSNRMLTRRGLPVTLDATGNITADGTGREYISNQAGQLAQVKQGGVLIATYEYDTDGLRMSKTTTASAPQGAQTVVYHYDLDGKLIAETTATGSPLRAYIWRDDTPASQIEYVPSRKVYHFNVDHLNTPRSLMDDTGKIVWRWESDAFGSTTPNEDVDGDGVKMTSNLRFPGQYYDKETGLHYNWHRYYDPSMGQYPQADPIGLAGGTNLYAYVGGNPISNIDPEGKNTIALGAGGGALIAGPPGAVVGAVIGGVVLVGAVAYEMCKDDDDECQKLRDRDEAACALLSGTRYGSRGVGVCMRSAAERYAECLRFGPNGVKTPLHGVDTPL